MQGTYVDLLLSELNRLAGGVRADFRPQVLIV